MRDVGEGQEQLPQLTTLRDEMKVTGRKMMHDSWLVGAEVQEAHRVKHHG